MNKGVYKRVLNFKKKYSFTLALRLKKHSQVIENILDDDEETLYAFCGQRNDENSVFFATCVVCLTNKRIIIGQKRVLWGYFVTSISPELFNDLKIYSNLLWGKVEIDTAKEVVFISNLDKHSLDEVETSVNKIMLENKRRIKMKSVEQ